MADNGKLDEAVRQLTLAQAALVQNQATAIQTQQVLAQTQAMLAGDMAEIRKDLHAIASLLADHGRVLERLPDAIRDRLGFTKPVE